MPDDAKQSQDELYAPFHEVRIDVDGPDAIRASFEENGYLLFKGVLDRDLVLTAKAEAVAELQRQGVVKEGGSQPVAMPGLTSGDVDDDPLYALTSYLEIMASDRLREAIDFAYGEPGYIAPSVGFRYSMPTDAVYLTPNHQDHFFIRQTDQFRMIWIPLMDLELANGGLVLAAGSHRRGVRDHVELPGVLSYGFKGRTQKGILPENVGGVWSSSAMEAGDFLMFHSCAVHRAIPNTSDLVRLSINTLTYPARLPRLWQAEKSIPDLRSHRETLKQLADEEGIGEDLFEKITLEAMKQGADPSRELLIELAEVLA